MKTESQIIRVEILDSLKLMTASNDRALQKLSDMDTRFKKQKKMGQLWKALLLGVFTSRG